VALSHPLVHQPLVGMKDEPVPDATYQLVIRGELGERYGYLFEGMQMESTGGTTTLVGRVLDQAQLFGLIERIEELGLELVSVQQVATGQSGSGQERNET
jgi:hypothetical protein